MEVFIVKLEKCMHKCHTSTHMTDVTCAPMFTTHAVDNPFPNTVARASWKIIQNMILINDNMVHSEDMKCRNYIRKTIMI